MVNYESVGHPECCWCEVIFLFFKSASLFVYRSLTNWTHHISQSFNVQFPKLTTIHWKFLHADCHVTKYCHYVTCNAEKDWSCSKINPDTHSHFSSIIHVIRPTPTNARHSYKCILGSMCMIMMIVAVWEKLNQYVNLKITDYLSWSRCFATNSC